MTKRFTDTTKYKTAFFRSLPGPYKLFWDFLYHECNHAAIWHVDFEVAQVYLGKDMPVDTTRALELFNAGEERVVILGGGHKWFIRSFLEDMYKVPLENLNPGNRVHASVLEVLQKEGAYKPLASHLQGAKNKNMNKNMNKEGGTGGDGPQQQAEDKPPTGQAGHVFEQFRMIYPCPQGVFEDEAECLLEIEANPAIWNQLLLAAKNFAASERAQKGIGIYKPITFIRKQKWREWLVVKGPSGGGPGAPARAPDHAWKKEREEWEQENTEYDRKVAAGEIVELPRRPPPWK